MDPCIIQTYSGVGFDANNPRPSMIRLKDIARGLAFQCRFNGHVSRFYSVAEHSVRASVLAAVWGREAQRAVLLHDAAEAYLGDLVSPLKNAHLGIEYRAMEGHALNAIAERYGVDFACWADEIKQTDIAMLSLERKHLIPTQVGEWPDVPPAPCMWDGLGLAPEAAMDQFLQTADALGIADPVAPGSVDPQEYWRPLQKPVFGGYDLSEDADGPDGHHVPREFADD
jgi:hypothetical protein